MGKETKTEPVAAALEKRCSAVDTNSAPARQCELKDGHEGQHEWSSEWPKNLLEEGQKKFTRKF